MAPEMIQNGSHNHTLDVWCLGILLYELLHGHAPFTGSNYNVISERIMKGRIRFKKDLPQDARSLIGRLLQREANDRIPLIKVFNHPWVVRLQQKHNLVRKPSIQKLRDSKRSMPQEEEKSSATRPKKSLHEDSKLNEMHFSNGSKYHDKYEKENYEDLNPEHRPKSSKKKEYRNNGVSPNKLEEELLKIEQMEAQKRKMLEEPKRNGKFDKLLKPSPKKEEPREKSYNLLDLSQNEIPLNKTDLGFHPKFEKLQRIESKNAGADERESNLPQMEDFERTFTKKPPKVLDKPKVLHSVAVEKFPEDAFADQTPTPSKNKSSIFNQEEDEIDEDELLDNLHKNMQDTSFIGEHDMYNSKYLAQKKKNEEIMKLLGGLDEQYSKIEVDNSKTVNKNKSAFLSRKDIEDKPYEEQKSRFEAGDKILNAVDKFGYDFDAEYQAKLQRANQILAEEDGSVDSSRCSRDQPPNVEVQHSVPQPRESHDLLGIEGPDLENSEPERDQEDEIQFLKMNKSALQSQSSKDKANKSKNYGKTDYLETDPFDNSRDYKKLDTEELDKFVTSAKKAPKNDMFTNNNLSSVKNTSKNGYSPDKDPFVSPDFKFSKEPEESRFPNSMNKLKMGDSPSKIREPVKAITPIKQNSNLFFQDHNSEVDSSDQDSSDHSHKKNGKKTQEVVNPKRAGGLPNFLQEHVEDVYHHTYGEGIEDSESYVGDTSNKSSKNKDTESDKRMPTSSTHPKNGQSFNKKPMKHQRQSEDSESQGDRDSDSHNRSSYKPKESWNHKLKPSAATQQKRSNMQRSSLSDSDEEQ